MIAMTTASPMPGMTPNTATPTKQTIESQNSQRWIPEDAPEIPVLEQADRRGDDDGRQSAARQALQKIGREHQQRRNANSPDDSGQLRPRAGGVGYGSPRGTAADRKPLEQTGGEIGGAQANHLLIRIDPRTGPRRIRA